jgi:hypothetical protein
MLQEAKPKFTAHRAGYAFHKSHAGILHAERVWGALQRHSISDKSMQAKGLPNL